MGNIFFGAYTRYQNTIMLESRPYMLEFILLKQDKIKSQYPCGKADYFIGTTLLLIIGTTLLGNLHFKISIRNI